MVKRTGTPRILIFTSEGKEAAQGLLALVGSTLTPIPNFHAEVACIVSDKSGGEIHGIAKKLQMPFESFTGPFNSAGYGWLIETFKSDFVVLYDWLPLVVGLDTPTTIGVHQALLPKFGGRGMYRRRLQETVLDAFHCGEASCSGFTVYFVGEELSQGPIIYQSQVPIYRDDMPGDLAARIRAHEHGALPIIINYVVWNVVECLPGQDGKFRMHPRNEWFGRVGLAHQAGNQFWSPSEST